MLLKKINLFLFLIPWVCFLNNHANADTTEFDMNSFLKTDAKIVKAPVDSVEVYQNKAMVERQLELKLQKGENKFVIMDLPLNLYPNTLWVYKVDKNSLFNIKEFELKKAQDKVILGDKEKKLKKELDSLKEELGKRQDAINVIGKKIKFYSEISAKSAGEASKNLILKDINIRNMTDVLEFVSNGLDESMAERRKIEKEIKKISDEIKILASHLSDIQRRSIAGINVLFIRIIANADIESSVTIKYVVANAYWTPYYEINFNPKREEIEAKCFAKIVQTTSEKWTNVKLTLSTGSPLFDVTLPETRPWIVRAVKYRDYKRESAGHLLTKSAIPQAMEKGYSKDELKVQQAAKIPRKLALIQKEELNIRMELTGRFDILNTGEAKKVSFRDLIFKNSDVFYTAIPTKNRMAYLTVEFENDSDMLLLAGESSLYLNANYTDKGRIKENIRTGEKIKFSFGVDENIKIEKETLHAKTGKKGLFKGKNRINYGFKIEIENYKDKKIDLFIEEPVPFSEDEDIKVDFYEANIKVHEKKDRGIYIWKLKLNPKEKKELIYKFRISYPKDMHIQGL